jgi:hypothetical protein
MIYTLRWAWGLDRTIPHGFMDVPTLVSLGSTNKKNQGHLSEQSRSPQVSFPGDQNRSAWQLLSVTTLCLSWEGVSSSSSWEACRLIRSGLRRVDHEFFYRQLWFTSTCSVLLPGSVIRGRTQVTQRTPHRWYCGTSLGPASGLLSFQKSLLVNGQLSRWHSSEELIKRVGWFAQM